MVRYAARVPPRREPRRHRDTDRRGAHARALPIQSFHGDGAFPDMHAASRHPFEIELQDFGRDSTLCRRIGNEVYCY